MVAKDLEGADVVVVDRVLDEGDLEMRRVR